MRAAESTHWYTESGIPAYTVKAKDGSDRPTTLRDARKLNLYPSVTTVIRCAAAPALEKWKRDQVLMAALTLPRLADEPEAAWLRRVETDSGEQARKAAERGTAIHAAIQGHYEGNPPDEAYWPHVKGCAGKLIEHFGERQWLVEKSFAHPMGYGGKTDIHCDAYVLDFKSKEFGPDKLPETYDEHAMQLAAYRHGLNVPSARCGIAYVSVSVPGLVHIVMLSEDELQSGWAMFSALLAYWQAKNGYRPTLEKAAA
jgi:hypothetical protein